MPTDTSGNRGAVTIATNTAGTQATCSYAIYEASTGYYASGTPNFINVNGYTTSNLNGSGVSQPSDAVAYVSCNLSQNAVIWWVNYTP
jgi:hypothetical protein